MDIQEILNEIDRPDIAFFVNNMHIGAAETPIQKHNKGQLVYAEGGIVHVFIENKHWYLAARCFLWIPAHMEHYFMISSKNVELYNLYFKPGKSEVAFFQQPNIYFANDLLREMILFTRDWFGNITKQEPAKYYFIKAIQENLPVVESTKHPIVTQHPFPTDPKLFEIAHYLRNNLDTNYTIEEIAEKFGMSTRSLSRKFKENLGMNYVRFLRSLRITQALELLAEQKYNIYEIAMMVGYGSLASFSNIFYKVAGIRPTDYAKLLSK
jgi:AraC-like DNA-binding protein